MQMIRWDFAYIFLWCFPGCSDSVKLFTVFKWHIMISRTRHTSIFSGYKSIWSGETNELHSKLSYFSLFVSFSFHRSLLFHQHRWQFANHHRKQHIFRTLPRLHIILCVSINSKLIRWKRCWKQIYFFFFVYWIMNHESWLICTYFCQNWKSYFTEWGVNQSTMYVFYFAFHSYAHPTHYPLQRNAMSKQTKIYMWMCATFSFSHLACSQALSTLHWIEYTNTYTI